MSSKPPQPPAQDPQAATELPVFKDRIAQIAEQIGRFERYAANQDALIGMSADRRRPFFQAVIAEVRQWTTDEGIPMSLRLRSQEIRDKIFSVAVELSISDLRGRDDQRDDWRGLAARSWEQVDAFDIQGVLARYPKRTKSSAPPTSVTRRTAPDDEVADTATAANGTYRTKSS